MKNWNFFKHVEKCVDSNNYKNQLIRKMQIKNFS